MIADWFDNMINGLSNNLNNDVYVTLHGHDGLLHFQRLWEAVFNRLFNFYIICEKMLLGIYVVCFVTGGINRTVWHGYQQ